MEHRNVQVQVEEMEKEDMVVVDAGEGEEMTNEELTVVHEVKEEVRDAPSASPGISLINFLL